MSETPNSARSSTEVEELPGEIARILCALCAGELTEALPVRPPLPLPISLDWCGKRAALDDASWCWDDDDGELQLEVRVPSSNADSFDLAFDVLNQPAVLGLAGGSQLTARACALISRNHRIDTATKTACQRYTLALDSWIWRPADASRLWIGAMGKLRVDDGNLVICGESWSTRRCLCLRGRYDLYVATVDREKAFLVVDTHGAELDESSLGTELDVLDFALGQRVPLSWLRALDSDQTTVGVTSYGFWSVSRRSRNRRCPVADARDIFANGHDHARECRWLPVLFAALSRRLHEEGADSPLRVAMAAYLDSLSGMIHTNYLLCQVALEAVCASIVKPKSGVLVSDSKAWLKFVAVHTQEIESFASDADSARKLVGKVKNAQNAPSSDRVALALQHLGLNVPERALEEVRRRNSAAHNFLMAKESTADAQDLADRLAIVQTLLVAVIAKRIGFEGPIVGWEWINGRHRIPDWWHWTPSDAARRLSLAKAADNDDVPSPTGNSD